MKIIVECVKWILIKNFPQLNAKTKKKQRRPHNIIMMDALITHAILFNDHFPNILKKKIVSIIKQTR